jgi:hypothetical protein
MQHVLGASGLFRKPQFFSDAIAIGDVYGEHLLELFQLPRGRLGVAALRSSCDRSSRWLATLRSLDSRQMIFKSQKLRGLMRNYPSNQARPAISTSWLPVGSLQRQARLEFSKQLSCLLRVAAGTL